MSVCEQTSRSLSKGAWFCFLEPELQRSIVQHGRVKTFAAGEALFHQGDPPTGLHAILSGQAEVKGLTGGGVEVLMALLRPGEWTGFLASLDGGPYVFTVAAVEPTDVFTLPLAHVRRLFDSVEGLRALMKLELVASRRVYKFLIDLATMTPLQRLARRLLDLAHAAYDEVVTTDRIDRVSQSQISISIACSRQLANHLLGQLEKAGVITVSRGHIEIRDRTKLEALAHAGDN